jgi:hypothetical protein
LGNPNAEQNDNRQEERRKQVESCGGGSHYITVGRDL